MFAPIIFFWGLASFLTWLAKDSQRKRKSLYILAFVNVGLFIFLRWIYVPHVEGLVYLLPVFALINIAVGRSIKK